MNQAIKEIRIKGLEKYRGKDRIVSWGEKDFLDGETVDACVMILPTRGCRWGLVSGCSICGYVYDSQHKGADENAIIDKFEKVLMKLGDVKYLKIFNSGSFFDTNELSENSVRMIFEKINETGISRVQVESRPEFLEENVLKKAREMLNPELEVGIGLETTNDEVRINCVNKGFLLEDFEKALGNCKKNDIHVKAYLLIKPPFLSEKEAIKDAINSGIEAEKLGVDRISYNPINIQKGTLVELLWRRGEYRAPWLWSVVEVLKEVSSQVKVPVLSHPTAAGRKRGAHNCGSCDSKVYGSIVGFSITQDPSYLEGLDCECKASWQDWISLENYVTNPFFSASNPQKYDHCKQGKE